MDTATQTRQGLASFEVIQSAWMQIEREIPLRSIQSPDDYDRTLAMLHRLLMP